jgi:hypothetical protein
MPIITVKSFNAENSEFEHLQRRSIPLNEFLSVDKKDSTYPEVFYKINDELFVSLGTISLEKIPLLTKELILEKTEERYQESLTKNLHPWSGAYLILNKSLIDYLEDVKKYHSMREQEVLVDVEKKSKEMLDRKINLQTLFKESGQVDVTEMFAIAKYYNKLTLSSNLIDTLSYSIRWVNPNTKEYLKTHKCTIRKDSLIKLLNFTKEFVKSFFIV